MANLEATAGEAVPEEGEDEHGEAAGAGLLVHYSTGRLTRAQADLLNTWRARLREDRPLPGQQPVSAAGRMLGASNRPRASGSDVVAAAVADLLARHPPAPLELARDAYAGMLAQRAAAEGRGSRDAAALYPPVSWYLTAELAGQAEDLRTAALAAVHEIRLEVRRQAYDRHPGGTREAAISRALYTAAEMARLGLPFTKQIPRGTIARVAITRWAARSADRVAAAAVAYASSAHDKPHRARSDIRELRR
ncbi:MAG: hypothetical protein ACRDOL_31895 [Streptosporangiaceae bacterium]